MEYPPPPLLTRPVTRLRFWEENEFFWGKISFTTKFGEAQKEFGEELPPNALPWLRVCY